MIYFTTALISFLITFFSTPQFIKLSHKLKIYDYPSWRKIHSNPIPILGGPAVFLGFSIPLFFFHKRFPSINVIIITSAIILITGMLDDIFKLSPYLRLFVQLSIAMALYACKIRIEYITHPIEGMYFLSKIQSMIITIIWVVGITNALNFIDGLDGLSSGISSIVTMIFFLLALSRSDVLSSILAISLFGSSLGFLRWNFFPAKIFLGDSGAYSIGLIVSIIAIIGAFKTTTTLTFIIPILVLGIPIFDVSFAVIRRLKDKKNPISTPDRSHLHHQLLSLGLTQRQVVFIFYLITLILGVISFIFANEYNLIFYLFVLIILAVLLIFILRKTKSLEGKK